MAEQTAEKGKGSMGAQVPETGKGKPDARRVFGRPRNENPGQWNERLIRWLNSPMERMHFLAIAELFSMDAPAAGAKGGNDVIPVLIEALSHSDHNIRANAATLLSRVGGPKQLRYLKMLLSDRSPAVCAVAEMAVFEIVKRHFREMDPKSVEAIAARLGGYYGRELDRMLGKDVPEPEREKGEEEDV